MPSKFGYTDSFTSKSVGMTLPSLDYDKDFAVVNDNAGNCILANITTPIDQPETIRFAIADVANVYKNTQIVPLHRENGLRGKKLLVSMLDTARVTQGTDSVDYPVKVGLTVEYPLSANIAADDLWEIVQRCVACTQDYMKTTTKEVADSNLLNKLSRGMLNPQDGIVCATRS